MSFQMIGTISQTSPATASTDVSTSTVSGLEKFDEIQIEAILTQATGGTLDVYVQRKVASGLWSDIVHFTQLSAGSTVFKYSVRLGLGDPADIFTVGGGNDGTPGVALAADTVVPGHPGAEVRAVFVAGASTSAGAAQAIRFLGRKA